jgi:hypothetical protein
MAYGIAKKQAALLIVLVLFVYSCNNVSHEYSKIQMYFDWLKETQDIRRSIKQIIVSLEAGIGDNVWGRDKFVEFYSFMQVIFGKEEVDSFYGVKDKEGRINYASFFYYEDYSQGEIQEIALRVKRLKDKAAEDGTKLLFVNPPALYIRDRIEYSAGLPYRDYNHRVDGFLYRLQNNGVEYIDLRETLLKYNIPIQDFFYKTDHHWRFETAFNGFIDIIDYMNEKFDAGLDPDYFYRNINNYDQKTYPKASLGSLGKRSGIHFSGLDDFTVLIPKFETRYTDIMWHLDPVYRTPQTGTVMESMVVESVLNTTTPYDSDFYSVYQGGIKGSEMVVNHLNPQGPKILFIHDSMSMPLIFYMAPMFSEIHQIWTATQKKTSIEKYIEENIFDYIIVESGEASLNYDNIYYFPSPWHKTGWD